MPSPRLSCGPFLGMRAAWQEPFDPKYAYMAVNMLPRIRGEPSQYLSVPWPSPISTAFTGGGGIVQGMEVLRVAAPVNVAVISGEIYTEDSGIWFKQVSTANLTTAGIVLANVGRVFMVPFNGLMLISDGVNLAFTWNGTAGAGGLVELTNAPVFYGRPTVYYGKVFGIKDTERDTIVWSEENA